jgi:O-antigen/teichoic acid export membrane protein
MAMTVLYAGSTGLTFLTGILLARLLGAASYGTYALAMTSSTLLGLAAEFGLPTLAMRETGRARAHGRWGELRGLLRWSDRAILAFSALLAVICYGVVTSSGTVSSAYLKALLWGMLLIPAVAIGKLRSMVLLAFDRVYSSQIPVMIVRPVLFMLGCLIAWRLTGRLDAPFAMAVQVAGTAASTMLMITLFLRQRPRALSEARPVYALRSWLATCVPMGMSEGLRLLQGQLALLMVGYLATSAAAGVYRVADAASQLTSVVASIVGTATTAMFARLHGEGDQAGLQRVALLSAWSMVGGALVLGLPIAAGGKWLFPFVFGHDFAASFPLFMVLWGGGVAASTSGLPIAIANMTGHHVLSTQSFMVIAGLNALIGALLIPGLGAFGGAVASALAIIAGMGYCAIRLRRLSGINSTVFARGSLTVLLDVFNRQAARGA